jgi:ubiquinone/menaquinone biosynthesis C-methylase UbiE
MVEEGFLNPNEVLEKLELRKNMVAADFGSGSGGWSIPLAKKLKEGRVYAIDILEEPLSALKSKARLERVFNIETKKADVEKSTRLISESCDLVLITNLLFESEEKEKVLEEAKRVLKKGGEILVVDWNPEIREEEGKIIGPPKEKRVSPEEIKKIAEKLDLKIKKEFKAGLYHWALILVK